ncbi:MAG: hypothetical protein KGI60_00595 [Patescibacteria group bacterium]|nr:hypothetical protein [Patescibacteria group bacterium]
MKKIVLLLVALAICSATSSAECISGSPACWLKLREAKNQKVTVCYSHWIPAMPMREYFLNVARIDRDLNSVRLMHPPRRYQYRLDTPFCMKGVLSDVTSQLLIEKTSGVSYTASYTMDKQSILMVYKKPSLLRKILTLGFAKKKVIYAHPALYELVQEQPSDHFVN